MFRAEKMRAEDFSFAVQLANTMDWNMAESDLEFMHQLEPDGCFTLWQNQERIGIATCISYGKIGWFGNLAVKPEYRREGAGTFLVKHAMEYLKAKGVETIGLYAYQHLEEFYGEIGFKPRDEFVLFSGQVTNHEFQDDLKEADEKDAQSLTEFDRQCFGWNRQRLFESILREKGNLCYYCAQNGKIVGFGMAKVYDEMAEIGPLVFRPDHEDVAVLLLESLFCRLNGLDIYVCVPTNETTLIKTLIAAGLKGKVRLTRMFLGAVTAQNCVCVPESLERG